MYRLLTHRLASEFEKCVNCFGIFRCILNVRESLLDSIQRTRIDLLETRELYERYLEERRHQSQTYDALYVGNLRDSIGDLQLSMLSSGLLTCVRTAIAALNDGMSRNLSIQACYELVTSATTITNRLVVPFQTFHDFPPSKIAYPKARHQSVASAKALHGFAVGAADVLSQRLLPVDNATAIMNELKEIERILLWAFPPMDPLLTAMRSTGLPAMATSLGRAAGGV
jgi:hypothetical protein